MRAFRKRTVSVVHLRRGVIELKDSVQGGVNILSVNGRRSSTLPSVAALASSPQLLRSSIYTNARFAIGSILLLLTAWF